MKDFLYGIKNSMGLISGIQDRLENSLDVTANIQNLQLSGNESNQIEKVPQSPTDVQFPGSPSEARLPRSPFDLPGSPGDLESEMLKSVDSPKSELDALSVALAGN